MNVGSLVNRALGGAKIPPPPPPPPFVARAWFAVPQPLRFFVGGNLGNLCFYYCELAICAYMKEIASSIPQEILNYKDSVSYFLGYMIHIPAQHFIYALLVYGIGSIDTPTKYIKTLIGMYATMLSSAVGSTALNGALLSAGMDKAVAFICTLWLFACINYVVIGWIVKKSNAAGIVKTPVRRISKQIQKTASRPSTRVRGGGVPSAGLGDVVLPLGCERRKLALVRSDWIQSIGRPVLMLKDPDSEILLVTAISEL